MSTPIYRTDFLSHCRTHAIDGMTLIFHRPSVATHFVGSPIPEMLALLAAAPTDAAGLCLRLCEQLGLPSDAEALAVVEARLAELVGIGLVQAD